jgi:hypothetical protein
LVHHLCRSGPFQAFYQFIGDIRAFEPHDAFFRIAEAQQVDTPIPYDPLINYREFLMDVRATYHTHTGALQ